MFPLEELEGLRVLTRSRLFGDEEQATLETGNAGRNLQLKRI